MTASRALLTLLRGANLLGVLLARIRWLLRGAKRMAALTAPPRFLRGAN